MCWINLAKGRQMLQAEEKIDTMTLEKLSNTISDKPIFNIEFFEKMILSFDIGPPSLSIETYKDDHPIFKKMRKYIYNQNYYSVSRCVKGSFHTDMPWILELNDKEICNSSINPSQIEKILSFLLEGHSISKIAYDNDNKGRIYFSNSMRLTVNDDKYDEGFFWFFTNKDHMFEVRNGYGYKYHHYTDIENRNWQK